MKKFYTRAQKFLLQFFLYLSLPSEDFIPRQKILRTLQQKTIFSNSPINPRVKHSQIFADFQTFIVGSEKYEYSLLEWLILSSCMMEKIRSIISLASVPLSCTKCIKWGKKKVRTIFVEIIAFEYRYSLTGGYKKWTSTFIVQNCTKNAHAKRTVL
jgi:hypothetical protein